MSAMDQHPTSSGPPTVADSASTRLAALFPEVGGTTRRHWWQHRARVVVTLVVLLAVVATTAIATDAFGSTGGGYRSGVVAERDVQSVIAGVGTIEPVAQASVSFPVAGTVATVEVTAGDSVTAGQTLATLDTQSLVATLHEQEAALAQAELTLSKALDGESVGGVTGGSAPSGGSGIVPTASTTSAARSSTVVLIASKTAVPGADPALAAAQQAVLVAQQQVDAALTAADTSIAAFPAACDTTNLDLPTCEAAIEAIGVAQQQVSTAQRALTSAATAYDELLQQYAATSSSAGSGSGPATASPSTGVDSGASTAPSSADLVAYQKAVDAAAADVAVAEQALGQAAIVSPIDGIVAAVDLAVGDDVDAASATDSVVVTGPEGFEVTTTVSVDRITDVAIGQAVVVRPDGTSRASSGQVVTIAAAPDSGAGTTTSYRVVIALEQPDAALNNGSTASVAIVTDEARRALAVPTSAVTTNGTRSTVEVLAGGTTETVVVEVGVVGDTWTEITSGVEPGQEVVLASLGEPLPSSATSSSNGTTTDFQFPGGGGGGGGFPIGPPGQ